MSQFVDPSQDYILQHPKRLDPIFNPTTVALIGAKDEPGSVGRTLLSNLLSPHFSGRFYPVNPKREHVLGKKCYPSLNAIPERVDLAIIAIKAEYVPQAVKECVAATVRSCIVISAGFKETGEEGKRLEEAMIHEAKKGGMPLIGPNCLGVMNPLKGLNATFADRMALPGHIAFLSQSGAMCTSVLDWSFRERIGFSGFVSVGSMGDVEWGDLIDYYGSDPETHSLLLYMETVGDSRKFLSAAREIALEKPIIVIKAGKSEQAAKAAASHTGSLVGSDQVFETALERVGVLRVNSISELFNMAAVLSKQPRPIGPKLAIITNAGGPSVLAVDALIDSGAALAPLSTASQEALNVFLPPAWSHGNPVDILGDADPGRFSKALEVIDKDPANDGVLVILSPQDMTDPTRTALEVANYAHRLRNKPLMASWMGGDSVAEGAKILNASGIPTFEYPDDAAKIFGLMWKYSHDLETLYQTPLYSDPSSLFTPSEARKEVEAIIIEKRKKGELLVDEASAKKILRLYGIPVVKTEIAGSQQEALALAEEIGYPCVLKLYSKQITHKSDLGGVKLNLHSKEAVENAFNEIKASLKEAGLEASFDGVTVQPMIRRGGYELILGCSADPQFGPVLLFGLGGQLVEVLQDCAFGLPPLNRQLAQELIQKTKVYKALKGVRGKPPVNMHELEEILVRFSCLVVEHPSLLECDMNPLLVNDEGCVALDARMVLADINVPEKALPRPAIRPYPSEYRHEWKLKEGAEIVVRPIAPEDEAALVVFHHTISENSIRQRFFGFVSLDERIAHERLLRICFNDFDREIALVAALKNKEKEIVGVVRISKIPSTLEGLLTMIILDAYHGVGLGTHLLKSALEAASAEGLHRVVARILSENVGMLKICERAGFKLKHSPSHPVVEAVIQLNLST